MSISAAMYAAVTGLSALSTGMQVISNNIANVNTVGFKAGRTNFEDLISQDYWSNGKIQQIGRGVKVASVQQMFTQGSFMNSAQDTDMAITGEGFFQVRDRVTNELMYTRAGNFTFDADGLLETPAGYVLQGWQLSIPKPGQDAVRIGVPVDVKVIALNAPPVETSQIKVVANLNADDSSAYIYSQSAWAGVYADQMAAGPAELERQAGIDSVFNWALDSADPTLKPAYNNAYSSWMASNGFVLSAGVYYKHTSSYPTASEITTVASNASAAAWAAMQISYSDPAAFYPMTTTQGSATNYVAAYNAAYRNYLVNDRGFTEDPSGTFYRTGSTPLNPASAAATTAASVAEINAKAAALASGVAFTTYPSGHPGVDAAYAAEYAAVLTTLGYSAPVPDYVKNPDVATDIAAAGWEGYLAAYAADNTYTTYALASDKVKLAYLAAYVGYLETAGYEMTYPKSTFNVDVSFTPPPTVLEKNTAAVPAVVAAQAVDPDFTIYPGASEAANLAYLQTLLYDPTTGLVSGAGFTLNAAALNLPTAPPPAGYFSKDISSETGVATALAAADLAGRTAAAALPDAPAGYAYPMGVAAWDSAYLTAYDTSLKAAFPGYEAKAKVDGFVKVARAEPDYLDVAEANKRGLQEAGTFTTTTGYPSLAPLGFFRSAWNNAYSSEMTGLGYTAIAPAGPPYFIEVTSTQATASDLAAAQAGARALAELEAANEGQRRYDVKYKTLYDNALTSITGQYAPWQLEGNGFAGAWDATDTSSPIDPENYTHANPWTIYDSLGTAHTLMVYYQPNPEMENVWDYIITCDPTEDARKDLNNRVVMNGATFAGVIQKGKITFSADGPDRHGGLVKDIEAQNIDMSKTAAAVLSSAVPTVVNPVTASSMTHAALGGYYTGKPVFSAATGTMVDSQRTYTVEWAGNLGTVPDVSGFTWVDDKGNTGTIPVYEKNYLGPYPFGSGLSISFTEGGAPMGFTVGDKMDVVAHSEEIGWTNLSPNELGYFDFDVAFVQSASMALHPPYPEGLPTIIQHISLDMGARNPNGTNGSWILDEQGTTQYASKSINIFSSQDGYPAGSLQRVSIDKDGILTGVYTNGRHQPLYQIGLTRFINPWGLAKLGDNVYMETRWSGVGTVNPPGYGGTGTIRANFLEQSNTDLADEIVNMIVTQRGFQANSKVVTTTDTMLAEVIEMKR